MNEPWHVVVQMVQRLRDAVDALPSIREATIAGVAPLAVRYDTDTASTAVHGTLAGSLAVGDRVLTVRLSRYVWVLGRRGGAPFESQGRVTITPSAVDTPTGVSVAFPVGRFTVAPRVMVTAATTVPGTATGVKGVSASSASVDGVTIYLTRGSTTPTGVDWSAKQMTQTSADG